MDDARRRVRMFFHEPPLPWWLHKRCSWLCGHCRAMTAYFREQA